MASFIFPAAVAPAASAAQADSISVASMLTSPEALRHAHESLIPRHRIAEWLLGHIDHFLDWLGVGRSQALEEIVYIIIIAAVALAIGIAVRLGVVWVMRKILKLHDSDLGRQILREHTIARCAHVIPPLVFMGLIPFAFRSDSVTLLWILRIVGIYALIAFGIGVSAVMNLVFNRYDAHENTRNLPIRGILNIGKGILWIIVAILIVSVLINKSPLALLAGLGAFATVLMLIFKDSIVGFTAGIQMSQNDMLHNGDWIVVPGTPANGIVLSVSLTTVKVRNFDNTIVTVPPYTLVQHSFQNWKGMSDSGVRRILRTVCIDYATIAPATPELIRSVTEKYPEMQALRPSNPDGWQVGTGIRDLNGTTETNLGLFRAYLVLYLQNNPFIAKDQRIMVRLLEPDNAGYPLQIWCFTNTTDFDSYESIQSAVMEHIFVAASAFSLAIYSDGSEDVTLSGALSASVPSVPSSAPSAPSSAPTASVPSVPSSAPSNPPSNPSPSK